MPMLMHGMTAEGEVIVNYKPDCVVGAKVHNVVLFGKVEIAQFGLQKHGIVVITPETHIVHEPEVEISLIGAVLNDQVLSGRRVWVRSDREEWLCDAEVVVIAVGELGDGDTAVGSGDCGVVGGFVVNRCDGFVNGAIGQ